MGQLVMGRYTVRCRCGKVVGISLEDAQMQCRKFAKRHGHEDKVRFYRCRWGSWHWTRKLDWHGAPETQPEPPAPEPSKKPKKLKVPAVHMERTIDWAAAEHVPPNTDRVIVQPSKLRADKWFWSTPHGETGYAADEWLAKAHARVATKRHQEEQETNS